MNRRLFLKFGGYGLGVTFLQMGCASVLHEPGPGMIVTFTSVKKGKWLYVEKGVTSNGIFFPTPGGLGFSKDGWGATMGGSTDGRQLPEWIEFSWKEFEVGEHHTPEEFRATPVQHLRVKVRERVPLEIVAQAIAARRETSPGKLPDKDLWLYFEWADDGIRLHWRFKDSTPNHRKLLAEGGDPVAAK